MTVVLQSIISPPVERDEDVKKTSNVEETDKLSDITQAPLPEPGLQFAVADEPANQQSQPTQDVVSDSDGSLVLAENQEFQTPQISRIGGELEGAQHNQASSGPGVSGPDEDQGQMRAGTSFPGPHEERVVGLGQ